MIHVSKNETIRQGQLRALNIFFRSKYKEIQLVTKVGTSLIPMYLKYVVQKE